MALTPRSVFFHPINFLAFGCGSGLAPKAPGTWGSLAALVLFYLVLAPLASDWYLAVVVAASVAGVYICGYTARVLGVPDHPAIVWDEFAGLWLALWAIPGGWWWPLLGFALFRLLDITKPWPIGVLDRKLHGGLGIMLDDLLAGAITWVMLQYLATLV